MAHPQLDGIQRARLKKRRQGYGHSMRVTVEQFRRDWWIQCNEDRGPPYASCVKIFNTMNVYNIGQQFGKARDPNVEIPLPMALHLCRFNIIFPPALGPVLNLLEPMRDAKS